MLKDKENRISAGATLTFFGLLILLNNLGVFSSLPIKLRIELLDWRTFILYASTFFLLFKKDKTFGLILLVLGLLLRFHSIYQNIMNYSFLVIPSFFIITGITILFFALRKR